jgi:DNA polymerase (family X)
VEDADIARVLGEIADVLELTRGNPFKVRAYRQAAQLVDVHPGPISEVWRQGKLEDLPGIGSGIAGKIGELLETGRSREHDRLAATVPPGVLEMLRVEGVGPRTAAAAWKKLRITDLGRLEEACLHRWGRRGPGPGRRPDHELGAARGRVAGGFAGAPAGVLRGRAPLLHR